jgi:drug/metabolite transporter (DMT)-like permease
LGLPVLALGLRLLKVPFHVPRVYWREISWLALTNMIVWQALIILAVKNLSSGRAAILGYSMPIFSAVLGALVFGAHLAPRAWGGVAAAALGVLLLLWHELANLSGRPVGVVLALFAAATWALGTQLLRRTTVPLPTLTISFWMTVLTTVVMTVCATLFERDQWAIPPRDTIIAIVYNAVLIFGFAHAVWFSLARALPPVASTLSVMFIPILGVFSGAWWLGEVLHWQDWAAVLLVVAAIGSVLLPSRTR